MKIHPAEQNSVDWLIARSGIPTASEFDNLVTPNFKVRTGEMPRSYLAKKLAERWQGGPLSTFHGSDMENGAMLEAEASGAFELETGSTVIKTGLCLTDDGRIGASPDGLLGEDGGIEIKSPRPETQVRYLLKGTLPEDYAAQVHGALLVTGRPRWTFFSYCRNFPAFLLTIERDDEIQHVLRTALDGFLLELDMAFEKLVKINGGPPPPRTFTPAAPPKAPVPYPPFWNVPTEPTTTEVTP